MNAEPVWYPTTTRIWAVFAFAHYNAGGGWSDFQGAFETLAEAREHAKACVTRLGHNSYTNEARGCAEIVNLQTGVEWDV